MSNDDKIWLNVGGMRFWTKWSTLRQPMCSRLSRLSLTNPEYDPQTNEFCFDRSGVIFDYILDVHRTGKLHVPHDICAPKILEEMKFWEVSPEKVASCCWGRIRDYCNSAKRVLTLRQALGRGDERCQHNAFNTQDSSNSGPSCCTKNGFISVLKELRMFFRLAVDRPFYSRKTKVSVLYNIIKKSLKSITCVMWLTVIEVDIKKILLWSFNFRIFFMTFISVINKLLFQIFMKIYIFVCILSVCVLCAESMPQSWRKQSTNINNLPNITTKETSKQRPGPVLCLLLSLAWSKLRLCSANHRAGYFSNLACDWLSIVWAYYKQETENEPKALDDRIVG